MKEFELTNKNGSFDVEVRSDGGLGFYFELSEEAKSRYFAMSKEELMQFAIWLSRYLNNVYGVTK